MHSDMYPELQARRQDRRAAVVVAFIAGAGIVVLALALYFHVPFGDLAGV